MTPAPASIIFRLRSSSRTLASAIVVHARWIHSCDAELIPKELKSLGLPGIKPEHVKRLDSEEHIPKLQQVGQAVANSVKLEHFARFI